MPPEEDLDIQDEEESEEGEVIELDTGEPPDEETLEYEDDEPNLVATFVKSKAGRKALDDIVHQVVEDFDRGWEDSEEYREDKAKQWKVFSGDLPPKEYPWEHCANANVPIALENITRLTFRASSEIFGDWRNVVGVQPIGPDDVKTADILSKHGNYQIREGIPDFKRQQYRGLLLFFSNGDVSAHSFYDPQTRRNRHEILTCDDLVVPYVHTSTMPDYSDVPYLVKIVRMSRVQLERMRGAWYDVDAVLDEEPLDHDEDPKSELREAESDVQKVKVPEQDPNAPFKLYQWEGWMQLPNKASQRFVQAVVDPKSSRCLMLQIHEEADWRDLVRYERQKQELDVYRQGREAWETMAASQEASERQALSDPNANDADRMETIVQRQTMPLPPPPAPPAWLQHDGDPSEEPDPVRMVPVHSFSHGVCIEPMVGNLGLGFGRIETDFNLAANTALSQFIDAASLANNQTLITTEMVTWEDDMDISPGAKNVVTGVSGSELQSNIMPLKFQPANPQLLDVVDRCYQWGQSAIQAPAVLSGEAGKSGETYRGISTRVEQATKQLSEATRRYSEFLSQILKNNARLNAIFMDDEEILSLYDHAMGEVEELRVGRAMYNRDYNVTFSSDLKFTPEMQKIQEADAVLGMIGQMPQLQNNLAILHRALKKSLVARGQEDMVALLGPEPPPPETPLGIPAPPPGPPPGQEGGPQGGPPPPPQGPPQ